MLFRDSRNYIEKHDTPSCVPLTAGDLLMLYLLYSVTRFLS